MKLPFRFPTFQRIAIAAVMVSAMILCLPAIASTTITAVKQTPWIVDDHGLLKSETMLTIESTDPAYEAWIKITAAGEKSYVEPIGTVASGKNEKLAYVLELRNNGDDVTFEIFDSAAGTGIPRAQITLPQKKIRHWKAYVAQDMHLDIGYTDYQETLKNSIWPSYLDSAFAYIDKTKKWDKNDRFHYLMEASYMILGSAWAARDADWIETLKTDLAAGGIGYASGYMNNCMENMGTEELVRFNYYSERFAKDKFGSSSTKVLYVTDNPSLSWSNIDALVGSGIKYLMLRANATDSAWDDNVYPKILYIEGRNPANKILYYCYGHYNATKFGFEQPDIDVAFGKIENSLMDLQNESYPYDATIDNFAAVGDNGPIEPHVNDYIKAMNSRTGSFGRRYVYPQFISSNAGDFFQYIENNYSASIPTFKGTIENWWNFGAASTAYEAGISKNNHDKLAAAETFTTLASMCAGKEKYPYEQLYDAYNYLVIYDEHTWGSAASLVDDQWQWKRNNALACRNLTDDILAKSLAAISSEISTKGKTIAVYNTLSWDRTDIVRVKASSLPAHFDIIDPDNCDKLTYQKLDDGDIVFTAPNVPGLGYKCFELVERADDPVFKTSVTVAGKTLENGYFRITFDDTGSITSIIDKQNGNMEMVDSAAPYPMNQFIYYTTAPGQNDVLTEQAITSAALSHNTGPICGSMIADGAPAAGANKVAREVILYDSIPRIDIVNKVVKTEAPDISKQDEEAFFSFPLNMPDYTLRHEMPVGDVRPHVDPNINNPENEQFYSSSNEHYTVYRWIDAYNGKNYGLTLSPLDAPLVQYGERRSFKFTIDWNAEKPWVYSYVFNNKWYTNFQKTQPGPCVFRYSLRSHTGTDWKAGRSDKFGMEVTNGLNAVVIPRAQAGKLKFVKDQFINLNKDNVVLTTAKAAEANGEGIILRFNETLGHDTTVTVDLNRFAPTSVTETDLVENDGSAMDLTNGRVTFTIKGYGWKTIRVKRRSAPPQVTGVAAQMTADGTQITWPDSDVSYYEVFRGTSDSFAPGQGNYIASVSVNHFYDTQVKTGLSKTYFYKVRAVELGAKGVFSQAAQATKSNVRDTTAPTAPKNLLLDYTYTNRVSISWSQAVDDFAIAGYKVFRDGQEIKTLPSVMNSYLDLSVEPGTTYEYSVKAYDRAGNLSWKSRTIRATTSGVMHW